MDKVSESTSSMLQRLDAMEGEFGTLMESLRTGSNRLGADLKLLEGNLTEVSAATLPRPYVRAGGGERRGRGRGRGRPRSRESRRWRSTAKARPCPAMATVATAPPAADDAEGARLIALNMALNGTPREETDRYLSENFQLSDRDGLLDEVYASVEG